MFRLHSIRRFFRLPHQEKKLYLSAWFLLWEVRLLLWLLPFRVWRRIVASMTLVCDDQDSRLPVERVARAVHVMHHYVPRATCLTQALAAQTLLARNGQPSLLRIGVIPGAQTIDAHAWVQVGERVIIGNLPNLRTYAVLPAFELNNG